MLLIEVADTTARYDRTVKIPLYARHGILELWLLDLNQRHVEIYRNPDEGTYRQVDVLRVGFTGPEPVAGSGDRHNGLVLRIFTAHAFPSYPESMSNSAVILDSASPASSRVGTAVDLPKLATGHVAHDLLLLIRLQFRP